MKQNLNFEQVRIEDFNIAALRKAAREGRLYIMPAQVTEEERQQQSLDEIMHYVSRIHECTNVLYSGCIDQIWDRILHDPILVSCFITSRGKRQGLPNWYRVMSLVAYLLEKNIYRKREFSAVELHLRLEQTTKRNAIYTGSATTYFTFAQFRLMDKIIALCQSEGKKNEE